MNEKRGQQIDEMGAKNRGGQFYVYKGKGEGAKFKCKNSGETRRLINRAAKKKEINVSEH